MRVAQSTMYQQFVRSMNDNLSAYMESGLQSSTQKKVNRPSDDPVGMTRILNYRASIAQNQQFESNVSTAKGWLTTADGALSQTQTILTKLMEKASQASNGALTDENRVQISFEVRQLFQQLVALANTEYAGSSIFAGHKIENNAYEIGLGVSTMDPNLQTMENADGTKGPVPWQVTGSAKTTLMVRFEEDATIGVDEVNYQWSDDNGATWKKGKLESGENVLELGGALVTIPMPDPLDPDLCLKVTGFDPDQPISAKNGTMLNIRPAAYYKGDDNDPPPRLSSFGPAQVDSMVASGVFSTDVRIRIDTPADTSVTGKVQYSYSSDNGVTWQTAEADTKAGTDKVRLFVPGGYLDVNMDPTAPQIPAGQQFVIRPDRASLGLEIQPGEYMGITNAGKDIFGGLYQGKNDSIPMPVDNGPGRNIFEVVCNLIAATETGNQTGCQQALQDLESSSKHILTSLAKVGGKENRVSLTLDMLQASRFDKEDRMSKIEDVDLTELVTRLAQQQMAYQSVLQSSSMIMQMNLMKYL